MNKWKVKRSLDKQKIVLHWFFLSTLRREKKTCTKRNPRTLVFIVLTGVIKYDKIFFNSWNYECPFSVKNLFWPNFKQKDDVNSDWVNLLLKIRAMDSFDFPECFIVCGSVNFNFLWYFTQFASKSWWMPVKLEKKTTSSWVFSLLWCFCEFVFTPITYIYLQQSSMSPVVG